jgi:hypothetical protein
MAKRRKVYKLHWRGNRYIWWYAAPKKKAA